MNRRTFIKVPLAAPLAAAAASSAEFDPEPEPQTFEAPIGERIDFTRNFPAPGVFPTRWICGSPSCMDNQDPPVQVHWYNEHTVIMRQNKAYSYEGPFMYLYFGNERILMLDQATPRFAATGLCATLWMNASPSGAPATVESRRTWNC